MSKNLPIIWDIFEKNSHHMSIVHALIGERYRFKDNRLLVPVACAPKLVYGPFGQSNMLSIFPQTKQEGTTYSTAKE